MSIEGYCEEISIHASTRGATGRHQHAFLHIKISIHASTRGATQAFDEEAVIKGDFNPRFHERSDSWQRCPLSYFFNFNPRFHERSDDTECIRCTGCDHYFNPRFHERSDGNIAQKICLFLYNTDNKYIIR